MVADDARSDVLWTPPDDIRSRSRVGRYMDWLAEDRGRQFDDYDELWAWSVDDLEGFWSSIWDYFGVRASVPYRQVLDDAPMPDTQWFLDARLNYAENLLEHAGDGTALISRSQTRDAVDLSWDDLRDQVARARAGLRALGVAKGDGVVAYLPNIPEAIVTFLACASLGAVFASCAPEFGVTSVLDRFAQLEPKVLVALDGYRFRGKDLDRRDEVQALREGLPTLTHVVSVPYLGGAPIEDAVSWASLVAKAEPLVFEQVEVDHPLYVLYSSGTTGLPKALVHGHGRILLEHLKVTALQMDLGPDDVLLQPATTAWMVWNFGISALLHGTTLVCFDGDPTWPDPLTIWRLAAEHRATVVNMGAVLLLACQKAGIRPADHVDLSSLRLIGSTGSPLPAEGFRWVYDAVSPTAMLHSGSGGTDICSGMVGGIPLLPVIAGEISCRYLGAAVEAYDAEGKPVRGELGELVIERPMPSMPVEFLGDPDRARYRSSYFDVYPGVWRHGDWIRISEAGTCIITGRSDSTLNRGGVRLGTSEFYAVVDALPEVADSVVVHLEDLAGGSGELILLLSVVPGAAGGDELAATVRSALKRELTPRHIPDTIVQVPALPRTLTGKKLEVPIKRILQGVDPATAVSRDAITNPWAIDDIARLRSAQP